MSKKLDINENELWVLSLFTDGYDREYYIRELSTILPVSHGTAQTLLERLETKQVLSSRLRGKIRSFKINYSQIATEYFVLAEQYKKISFIEEQPYIFEIMNRIDPFIDGITLLFGSYAKGTATPESDLDILVAGKCRDKETAKIAKMYDMEINIHAIPYDAFRDRDPQNTLLIEARKNHIAWKETERFVREVMG